MTRRARILLGIAVFLALCGVGLYLLQQLQPYQKTIKHGPSPEARSNDYLAAEHFLRQRQISVSRADNLAMLAKLPAAGHTLMLLGSRHNMTPRQVRQVLDWAAQGGHLLFVAESLWDADRGKSDDLLLDSLGIQQQLSDDLDEDDDADVDSAEDESADDGEEASEAEDEAQTEASQEDDSEAEDRADASEDDRYPELTKLYLENEEAPAYIDFDTEFHLYDAQNRAHAWANSGDSTHMLQLDHGKGLVTVLTDAWIWQNDNIGHYDNAWLLWYLSQDSQVTLLYSNERDNLFSQLLRHFPAALVALALLLALLLWHAGMRHGPLRAAPSLARRQLEEHLRGGADFLLRRVGQAHLLQNLQRDIQRRARHRHPGFERLAVAEQWQILGRLTRLPTSAISQAMRPVGTHRLSAADFTRQVANLQTLRNAL
ncbi:hypothetical protein A9179_16435 [Pseudomonas alcaligenes]|uniref:DUF4350 domain-containing protein n=1 Tax=Aquipseudomonas alcaligenes TaxID=43263 RepID=A0ABR7S417_AQUAC|nr:DUF4350 domain-containing protein [Pseudomonas alcaligenes]MBC9251859.1 hypothetical protein [Pseudomonas alcaligenes]